MSGRYYLWGGFSVLAPVPGAPSIGIGRTSPFNDWTDAVGHGAVIALDPLTGEARTVEVGYHSVRGELCLEKSAEQVRAEWA